MVYNLDYSKPFKVSIIDDCRRNHGLAGCLTGVKGVCLGLYEAPDNLRIPNLSKRAEDPDNAKMVNVETIDKICSDTVSDDEEVSLFNPLILTLSGEYIWGMECYFFRDESFVLEEDFWMLLPEQYRDRLRTAYIERKLNT